MIVSKYDFMDWLKKEDYSDWTDSGYPSTIHHYVYWIERVMKEEHIESFSELVDHIQKLLLEYGKYGNKKKFGEKGHATVINALNRFMDYLLNERNFVPKTGMYFI